MYISLYISLNINVNRDLFSPFRLPNSARHCGSIVAAMGACCDVYMHTQWYMYICMNICAVPVVWLGLTPIFVRVIPITLIVSGCRIRRFTVGQQLPLWELVLLIYTCLLSDMYVYVHVHIYRSSSSSGDCKSSITPWQRRALDVDICIHAYEPPLACFFGYPAYIQPVFRLYLTVSLVSRCIPVCMYI